MPPYFSSKFRRQLSPEGRAMYWFTSCYSQEGSTYNEVPPLSVNGEVIFSEQDQIATVDEYFKIVNTGINGQSNDELNSFPTDVNLKKMFTWYQKNDRQQWPRNFQHYFMLCNNKTKNKKASENVVGGNVKFQIQMKKKYGIYWPRELMVKGFFWQARFFIKDFLLPLSHKYKQDENKRNSD